MLRTIRRTNTPELEILLQCCGTISANGRSKQGPVFADGTSRVQGVTSVTLSSQWWCHKNVRAQEHRQEARHHHTSQPSQRRCSQDCPLRQIPFNVAGKPRAAVGKKYLPLGKESRDNTASETSSARPGMCARIHPGRDRDR